MKSIARVKCLLILLLSLLVASCGVSQQDDAFKKLIKIQNVIDINQSIEMRLSPYHPSNIRPGALIHLMIQNKSNRIVRFKADPNYFQIFLSENGSENWKEIENSVEYSGEGDIIVPQNEIGFHETYIPVSPALEKDGKEKHIRVVATGINVENGVETDKAVSAYLDLTIQP